MSLPDGATTTLNACETGLFKAAPPAIRAALNPHKEMDREKTCRVNHARRAMSALFAELDAPWLLLRRAETPRDHAHRAKLRKSLLPMQSSDANFMARERSDYSGQKNA
jgi:hypothetical protein